MCVCCRPQDPVVNGQHVEQPPVHRYQHITSVPFQRPQVQLPWPPSALAEQQPLVAPRGGARSSPSLSSSVRARRADTSHGADVGRMQHPTRHSAAAAGHSSSRQPSIMAGKRKSSEYATDLDGARSPSRKRKPGAMPSVMPDSSSKRKSHSDMLVIAVH